MFLSTYTFGLSVIISTLSVFTFKIVKKNTQGLDELIKKINDVLVEKSAEFKCEAKSTVFGPYL